MTVPPLGEQQGLWDIESRPKKMKLEAHQWNTNLKDNYAHWRLSDVRRRASDADSSTDAACTAAR